MIHLQSVVKSYTIAKQKIDILKGINIHIEDGEFATIMGPSGSGKTTLMNILGCLDKPTSGEYWLKGKRVSNYKEKELTRLRNQSIGFVFQQFQLLPRLSALKNVELPLIYAGLKKAERIEKAMEVLGKVGLSDRINHLPNELSGGQKQRVAIARAIVNEPSIVLADEPTGALDTKTGMQIMDLFTMLNKEGATIVVVTHNPEVATKTNRVIYIRDGLLIKEGTNINTKKLGGEEWGY